MARCWGSRHCRSASAFSGDGWLQISVIATSSLLPKLQATPPPSICLPRGGLDGAPDAANVWVDFSKLRTLRITTSAPVDEFLVVTPMAPPDSPSTSPLADEASLGIQNP